MQTRKPQLQRQQVIMAKLGFYRHKCDGIWGPESIAAKRKWEADRSFIPALPNNGLPFGERDPLPKGITVMRPERLLTMADLTYEEEERFLRRGQKTKPEQDPVPEQASESEESASETAGDPLPEDSFSEPEPELENVEPEPEPQSVPQFTGKKKKKRG